MAAMGKVSNRRVYENKDKYISHLEGLVRSLEEAYRLLSLEIEYLRRKEKGLSWRMKGILSSLEDLEIG